MLAFLISPLGKVASYAALAFTLVCGTLFWMHTHDNAVRAEYQARQDAAIAAEQLKNEKNVADALQAQAKQMQADMAKLNSIREKTHAMPTTSACADSPAVRALTNGLHIAATPRGPSPKAGRPAKPADVQAKPSPAS